MWPWIKLAGVLLVFSAWLVRRGDAPGPGAWTAAFRALRPLGRAMLLLGLGILAAAIVLD